MSVRTKSTSELVVLQVGSGPWQTNTEIGTGSAILHESLHGYLRTIVHRAYSFYQAAECHTLFKNSPQGVFVKQTPIWYHGKEFPFPCVYDLIPGSRAIFFDTAASNREVCLARIERSLEACLHQIRADTGAYPDIIYMHHASFNAIAMARIFQKIRQVIPMCVHLHGTELKAASDFGRSATHGLEQVLARAARVLYISTSVKDQLVKLVPKLDKGRLTYLPPWLTESLFYPEAIPEKRIAKPIVALISRFSAWKRIEALIIATRYFAEKISAKVELVGEGPHEPQLRRLVAMEGLQSYITFRGFMAHREVGDFLRKHVSILVNTSPIEPFGMTIIEAMACGVPVVATNSGGPADIVTPEIGWLVEDHPDIKVYAERLGKTILTALEENWIDLKAHKCIAAAERFGIHSRRSEIESLLQTVIQCGSSLARQIQSKPNPSEL